MKQFILRWLGIDKILRAALDSLVENIKNAWIEAEQNLRSAFAEQEARLKAEFEHRSGLVLEAALTASEKISRMVASQGDSNLKEYVDSCLNLFQEQTVASLTATETFSRTLASHGQAIDELTN